MTTPDKDGWIEYADHISNLATKWFLIGFSIAFFLMFICLIGLLNFMFGHAFYPSIGYFGFGLFPTFCIVIAYLSGRLTKEVA